MTVMLGPYALRFTPTRVGKTPTWPFASNVQRFTPTRVGKTHQIALTCFIVRFTPTRVGKTAFSSTCQPPTPVHPHACGENAVLCWVEEAQGGSPPRVWGKRRCSSCFIAYLWFTPTRVGKTGAPAWSMAIIAVHPHACGENVLNLPHLLYPLGSPPRVWGKQAHRRQGIGSERFTPTRVGKTLGFAAGRVGAAVHPHACGENGVLCGYWLPFAGSPPRVWGKPRFAPTWPDRRTVHPHACGENCDVDNVLAPEDGSPPRVWGKRKR